nr:tRNA lysidine(34) synthetase TilS [uncultured Dongia sp.]
MLSELGPDQFAALMAACGPFETKPHLAIGVSGGSDSLALMFLLNHWLISQGGKLTALTVDHGLRAESAKEAKTVANWASAAGIEHHVLAWSGVKPSAGIQAAARHARYDLMTEWCRAAGVLHLATAHQLDDQRETVAMRRARNPADNFGLAGMSLISARGEVRLLRPLLTVPGAVLKAYLSARNMRWLEDPSNQMERFERIRWRRGLEGPLPTLGEIQAWGEARVATEAAIADLLARSVSVHEAGFVRIDLAPWRAAQADRLPRAHLAPRALGQLIAMVGGGDYLPARPALLRALDTLLSGGAGLTLGGTLIGVWRGQGLICREPFAVTEEVQADSLIDCLWDRRFRVTTAGNWKGGRIGVLGERGLAEIGQIPDFRLKDRDIPLPARAALPAVRDATGRLIAVAHLGFDPYEQGSNVQFSFRPHYSATSSGFTVAYGWPHTI